jgi:hypothetical protein
MCQVFCGWRLITSKPTLVRLGSGILEIDALTGHCLFDGSGVDRLPIAEEICAWLQHDLRSNKIPLGDLTCARLTVKLSFSQVPWNNQAGEIFYSKGKPVSTERMNRCTIECDSNVSTDNAVYRAKLTEVQEWPLEWPTNSP